MKRKLVRAWLGAIIGAGLLIWAGYGLITSGDVRCGGTTMQAGDTDHECVHYSSGEHMNYAEQKHDNVKQSWITGGIGLLVLAGSGYSFYEVSRERRQQAPTTTP